MMIILKTMNKKKPLIAVTSGKQNWGIGGEKWANFMLLIP